MSDVAAANFLPELFHCSGFAVMNSATTDGKLYHGRILDYASDWHLQDHAVLIIAEPTGGIPFANVTFAGFIGSVTGMNAAHVSIGEMGGGGLGHWSGTPMAVLVREVLQHANKLDDALATFRDAKRTCQYYYVIADGKTNRAVGVDASWNNFDTIEPGVAHELLPKPVKDCVLLSAGPRYDELARRAAEAHGSLMQTACSSCWNARLRVDRICTTRCLNRRAPRCGFRMPAPMAGRRLSSRIMRFSSASC